VAFALTALVLIVVPGPSVLFVIGRALSLGRRAALATVVGNSLGASVQIVAVAFGMGALVERSMLVFTAVKLIGAAYLMVLGLRALRGHSRLSDALEVKTSVVRDGFVVGVSNPKVMVFFAAVLPQFTDPRRGSETVQLLVLGLVFEMIALVSDSIWGLVAGTARAWLSASPKRLERIGGAGGLVVIGLGLRLAFTGRKD
jgi:threonine/homoserine/homoserine lactone efflux protein